LRRKDAEIRGLDAELYQISEIIESYKGDLSEFLSRREKERGAASQADDGEGEQESPPPF
jgi:hypothetical protein